MVDKITARRPVRRLLLVFDTRREAFEFLCRRFRELSRKYIAKNGFFAAALSGGKTPVDLYVELGREADAVPWESVHLFLVDERFVPVTDKESNYRMIKESLLDAVPIPAANVHPIRTDTGDPVVSARLYEQELIGFFGCDPGVVPALHFVLLGLGEEGHTASLFPGIDWRSEDKDLVRAVEPVAERLPRVTLTLRAINNGRHVFFLVTGERKAAVVRRMVIDEDQSIPAIRVSPRRGELTVVADRDAAFLVDPKHLGK